MFLHVCVFVLVFAVTLHIAFAITLLPHLMSDIVLHVAIVLARFIDLYACMFVHVCVSGLVLDLHFVIYSVSVLDMVLSWSLILRLRLFLYCDSVCCCLFICY